MEFKRVTRQNQRPSVPPASNQATHTVPQPSSPIKAKKVSRRTAVIVGSGALVAVVLFVTASSFFRHGALSSKVVQNRESAEIIENVEYQTIVPTGKTIGALGGWKKISPPGKPAVYAFSDTIGGVIIQVSQQPLPDNFIGNAESRVAELAKSYNAQTTIDAGSTRAYLGTSAKGPQSVIFTKNNLLIMIKSQEKVPTASWSTYIKALN